jgi:hypothetical protein
VLTRLCRGSWQERQIVDENPFSLPQDDKRGKVEFYMPLVFYFIAWLVRKTHLLHVYVLTPGRTSSWTYPAHGASFKSNTPRTNNEQ